MNIKEQAIIKDILNTTSHYIETGALQTDMEISNAIHADAVSRGVDCYMDEIMQQFMRDNPQWFDR